MMLKDEQKFVKYTQIIPIVFGVIWIVMMFYIAYEAPRYPDEVAGRVYSVTYKGSTKYLTLIEEIVVCGSALGAVFSFVILQAIVTFSKKNNAS